MRRAVEVEASVAREGLEFGVLERSVAVGGQVLTLQGLGGVYDEIFLPLYGAHQAAERRLRARRRRGVLRRRGGERADRPRDRPRRRSPPSARRAGSRRSAPAPTVLRRRRPQSGRHGRHGRGDRARRSTSAGWSASSRRWPTRTSPACSTSLEPVARRDRRDPELVRAGHGRRRAGRARDRGVRRRPGHGRTAPGRRARARPSTWPSRPRTTCWPAPASWSPARSSPPARRASLLGAR